MSPLLLMSRLLQAAVVFAAPAFAVAQDLPLQISTRGNTATIVVVTAGQPSTEVLVSFDEAFNLNPASLGARVERVDPNDPLLNARLPDPIDTRIDPALPLLVTIEPPPGLALAFNRTVRVEVHTHALPYQAGSQYRLFKAPLNGAFRDVTDEIAPGSVRARGSTGSFSQFLVVTDVRPGGQIVAEKIAGLRARFARLPLLERAQFDPLLDAVEGALALGNDADAMAAVDEILARADARAGTTLPQQWLAIIDMENEAGEILAGASTLAFSIAYQRDFGP